MALARHVCAGDNSMKEGRWDRKKYEGTELDGKVLGLVGLGPVAEAVASVAKTFNMSVLGFDPSSPATVAAGVAAAPADKVLGAADFLVVLPGAVGWVLDRAALAAVKPGARVVNVGGARAVEEGALLDALGAGRVAGAALDGLAGGAESRALAAHPAVVCTPGLAGWTGEARAAGAHAIGVQVADALTGSEFAGVVNAPFLEAATRADAAPLMALADALGSLHAQILSGAPRRVTITASEADRLQGALAAGVLRGMIRQFAWGAKSANLVSARALLEEMGVAIEVSAAAPPAALANYRSLVTVVVESEFGDSRAVSAAVVGGVPRVVAMDDWAVFPVFKPEGTLLVFNNEDQPGSVASVTKLLADARINVASFGVARQGAGRGDGPARALSVTLVDQPIPAYVMAALRRVPSISNVHTATFQQ